MKKMMMVVAAGMLAAIFAFAEDAEIVKVKGRGVGADKTEALKDAYRDAVERAVGLYVDAEQMVKNDELVSDQILTQSNAYIEKFDVVKEDAKPNGLVEVQILAEVRKTALTKKISDVMPAQTFQLNSAVTQNLHAKLVTEEKCTKDGAALLKNVLEGVDPIRQLVKASLVSPEPKIVEEGGRRGKDESDTVTLRYAFKFEIDRDRYMTEFLPGVKTIFEQVAAKPAKTVRLTSGQETMGRIRTLKDELKPYGKGYLGYIKLSARVNDRMIATQSGGRFCKPEIVAVITDVGKNFNFAKALVCELDEESGEEACKWLRMVSFGRSDSDHGDKVLTYNAVVSGKDGTEICVAPIRISTSEINPAVCYQLNGTYDCCMMITPFVRGCSESYYQWVDFSIPKDELPNVANITIELAE